MILDAARDRREWLQAWEGSGREPFAHPSFSELFAGARDRAVVLVGGPPKSPWLLPLIVRPLRDILGLDADLYDATSPYGYGGPFCSEAADGDAVLDEALRWMRESGICSLFLRLSLETKIQPGRRSDLVEVVDTAENIVVDLVKSEDALWMGYDHKVRKNVNKARRSGCVVRHIAGFGSLRGFLEIYSATMERRAASSWYRFGEEFFERLAQTLDGTYSVFSVLDSDGIEVSVELVLEGDDYLYSFLGGTRAEAFPMAPNDLLKHEVAQYGQRTGRRGYVLGGGYQPGDGIFRYKRSFDPTGVRPFRTARLIADRDQYLELVERRPPANLAGDPYFPAYREPPSAVDGAMFP